MSDKPVQSEAQQLLDKPTPEVTAAYDKATQDSEINGSMVRVEFPQDDGSRLVIAAFQGGEAEAHVFGDGEDTTIQVPRTDDSADPEGVQDDGTNTYDDEGEQ